MSRYFQQLARHAGLAPAAPTVATASSPSAPSTATPQIDIVEEITEREAALPLPAPSPPAPSSRSTETPAGEADLEETSQTAREKLPPAVTTEIISPKAKFISDSFSKKDASSPTDQPSAPQAMPDAAAVIQKVIAWIAEPERARADAQAAAGNIPADKSVSIESPAAASPMVARGIAAEPRSEAIRPESLGQPPSIDIQISPRQTAARARSSHPSPVSAKKNSPKDESVSPKADAAAIQSSQPPRSPTPPSVAAKSDDASPSEFHVSIGSIHLTVEAPPAAAAPQPPAPRPAAPVPARARISTHARRHYLRSSF